MHIVNKSIISVIVAIALTTVSQRTIACEDIAVVSDDARYVVLSGDTLQEKDVGNLWWLGVRGIDYVAPGSTLSRAVVFPDRLVDVKTGILVPGGTKPILLHDIGRSLQSPDSDERTFAEFTLTKTWWVDDTPDSKLVGVHRSDSKQSIVIFGSDLAVQSEWPMDPPTLGLGVACEDRGRIIVAGMKDRLIAANDAAVRKEPLSKPINLNDSRLLGVIPFGCTALMAENVADANAVDVNADQLAVRTFDLATNQYGPKIQVKRAAENVLVAGGKKLLQQDLLATSEGNGTFRMTPTGRMRIVDTQSGLILKSANLPAGSTGRLFCRGEKERLTISAAKKIYLVDAETLSVLASRQIPFSRYFTF